MSDYPSDEARAKVSRYEQLATRELIKVSAEYEAFQNDLDLPTAHTYGSLHAKVNQGIPPTIKKCGLELKWDSTGEYPMAYCEGIYVLTRRVRDIDEFVKELPKKPGLVEILKRVTVDCCQVAMLDRNGKVTKEALGKAGHSTMLDGKSQGSSVKTRLRLLLMESTPRGVRRVVSGFAHLNEMGKMVFDPEPIYEPNAVTPSPMTVNLVDAFDMDPAPEVKLSLKQETETGSDEG